MLGKTVRALKKLFRKKLVIGLVLIAVVIGGYELIKALTAKSDAPSYATATVQRGTITVSVSGSGQIDAVNQVSITPKVSGDVVYVGAKNGDAVKAGTLLVKLDDTDAQRAVRNASATLETAELDLQQLLNPPALTLLQAQNALAQAQEAQQTAAANVTQGYGDAWSDIASAYATFPTLITNLHDILYGYVLDSKNWNVTALAAMGGFTNPFEFSTLVSTAEAAYAAARAEYTTGAAAYQAAGPDSDHSTIESLLAETLAVAQKMSEAVKSESAMINYWIDYRSGVGSSIPTTVSGYQTSLNTYASQLSSEISTISGAEQTLVDNAQAVTADARSAAEAQLSLENLQSPNELSVKQKQLAVEQDKNALTDAVTALDEHYIRAPFDGIVSNVTVKVGDTVGSGAIATLVTTGNLADISLNEVDVASVKLGQEATVTLDALPDVPLTGRVSEIDPIGTVSQGVVTYGVQIALDTQDPRVKPSMSLSADIITNSAQDVLLVPNAAVHEEGNSWYVETLSSAGTPQTVPVQVGLSNDTMTELTSGVQEGDKVITSTNSGTAGTTARTAGGLGGFGGGGVYRILR